MKIEFENIDVNGNWKISWGTPDKKDNQHRLELRRDFDFSNFKYDHTRYNEWFRECGQCLVKIYPQKECKDVHCRPEVVISTNGKMPMSLIELNDLNQVVSRAVLYLNSRK